MSLQPMEPSQTSPEAYDPAIYTKVKGRRDLDRWTGSFPGVQEIQVVFSTRARLAILAHAYTSPHIEVGGVMLGKIVHIRNGPEGKPIHQIVITESISAKMAIGQVGSLNFTPETWAEINREHDSRYPNLTIIGWYHTHPGHSVFLSGMDLHIQKHFWQQWYQLALVIDTHSHYGAFFINDPKQKRGPIKGDEFVWDSDVFQNIFPSLQGSTILSEPTSELLAVSDSYDRTGFEDFEPQRFSQEQLRSGRAERLQGYVNVAEEDLDQVHSPWKRFEIILVIAIAVIVIFLLVGIFIIFNDSILNWFRTLFSSVSHLFGAYLFVNLT